MRSMMTIDSAAIRLTDTILGHDELASTTLADWEFVKDFA